MRIDSAGWQMCADFALSYIYVFFWSKPIDLDVYRNLWIVLTKFRSFEFSVAEMNKKREREARQARKWFCHKAPHGEILRKFVR